MKRIDISGQRFGKLIALEYIEETKKWHCICDCGKHKDVSAGHLRSGFVKSCGCLKRGLHKKRNLIAKHTVQKQKKPKNIINLVFSVTIFKNVNDYIKDIYKKDDKWFAHVLISDKWYIDKKYMTKKDYERSRVILEERLLKLAPFNIEKRDTEKVIASTDESVKKRIENLEIKDNYERIMKYNDNVIVKMVNDVDDYENISNQYAVHRGGYIISFKKKPILLKAGNHKDGFANVNLATKDGKTLNCSVSQIVAKAFSNPNERSSKGRVLHLDGNRFNSSYDNLLWVDAMPVRRTKRKSRSRIDLTGRKFNKLTALEFLEETNEWICQCECGNKKRVLTGNLVSGNTKSCGCIKRGRPKNKK